MSIDLTKQPGAQPRGTETPLPDTMQGLEDYVGRLYATFKVPDISTGPRRAPPMPAVLRGGGGRR